jgi:polysaccharide biosynthesis transport protein
MGEFDLNVYFQPLRKWWWLIVLTTAVAGVSCYFFLRSQTALYTSQTTIMIGAGLQDPNPNNSQLGLAEQLAEAYADIARRAPLRQATMAALNITRLPIYTVKPVLDSPLIEIVVTAEDPALAQAVAQELVNQMILQSPVGQEEHERQQFLVEQLAKLEAGIQETEDEIARMQDELASMFSAREIASTQDAIFALQNKLSSLRTNYSSLLANSLQNATNRITILEPAALPTEPIDQNPILNLLMALVVGAVLGAGGGYLLEFLDDSIQNSTEVRQRLGIPLLASIPALQQSDKLVMLNGASPAGTEAYRGLRTNLQHMALTQSINSLVMTGPTPHEGKSVTAANVCISLALAGRRVILIDADLHRPKQHQLFQLSNTVGLTSMLLDSNLDLITVLKTTNVPNLRILTSGPLPHNPSELLGSERMQQLLDKLKAEADIVVLDTPPVNAVVDATVLAAQVDGVLLVLRAKRTSWGVAKRTLETLRQVRAPIIGAVLNGVSFKQSTYSYVEYGYGIHTPPKKTSRQQSAFSLLSKQPKKQPPEFTTNGDAKEVTKDDRHAA